MIYHMHILRFQTEQFTFLRYKLFTSSLTRRPSMRLEEMWRWGPHCFDVFKKKLILNIPRWLLRPISGWLEERWVFWLDSQFSVELKLSIFLSSSSCPLLASEDRFVAWWLSILNVIRFSIKEEVRNICPYFFSAKIVSNCIVLHCPKLKTQIESQLLWCF